MNNLQKYAFETTKDIVIAKLSSAAPNGSNDAVGEDIGDMFEAIYNKIYDICCKTNDN